MREKELRLALVCYGGASLAVYMNGISNEILKLVRASRAYHSIVDREDRHSATYRDAVDDDYYASDSEDLYFELLKVIGHKLDLRVVVDIVSGTSAGGINGIFLARALAHDLSFDPLRSMWLELGDIERLMDDTTLAGSVSKVFMYPLFWATHRRVLGKLQTDEDSKRKLSRFIRSRWFEPPFSGKTMLTWMVDACDAMGKSDDGNKSLMPPGHRLDLFVSVTNYHGRTRRLKLHDPAEIFEREHRLTLDFRYLRPAGQNPDSDFEDSHVPGLGFAARATSSFPGAFPPVQIADLETLLSERGQQWETREEFVDRNFRHFSESEAALDKVSFIDGGVTNNKPFENAIDAIQERPAHREVDRRVIYVDPLPDRAFGPVDQAIEEARPGFFKTILGALTTIPRNEPIYDDLRTVEDHNMRAKRLDLIVNSIDGEVNAVIDKMLPLRRKKKVNPEQVEGARSTSDKSARKQAGYAYASYRQARTIRLLERLGKLTAKLVLTDRKDDYTIAFEYLSDWANDTNIIAGCEFGADKECADRHAAFLSNFDVDYRIRRLRFVIKRLNQLSDDDTFEDYPSLHLVKRQIYEILEAYKARWKRQYFEDFWQIDTLSASGLPTILDKIADQMSLTEIDLKADTLISELVTSSDDLTLKRTLFRAYVGFDFYDVLTLTSMGANDLYEMDEIRIDRISPLDCLDVKAQRSQRPSPKEIPETPLLGTELGNFGAFFSKRARENDYIWGRIHGAHRLIDFVLDAAGVDTLPKGYDIEHLRKRLYKNILDTERKHMPGSSDLIDIIEKSL